MDTIKINFGEFWPSFKKEDNYFTRAPSAKYKVEISDDPQLYFFTHAYYNKRDYLQYKCHRVFLGWENERADWTISDYVLDFDYYINNPRHKRWPIWAAWRPERLIFQKDVNAFKAKKNFCCMVVSNGKAKERIDFFHQLSKYKQVDSGGMFLNNIGGPVADKMEFIKDYKFVISFENSSHPGYTTEKLIQPMLSNTIPIYWGDPLVGRDFNTDSFINISGPDDYADAIEKMITLDQDEEKYLKIAGEPWFTNNLLPSEFNQDSLSQFLDFVIQDSRIRRPVATSKIKNFRHRLILLKYRIKGSLEMRFGLKRGFR